MKWHTFFPLKTLFVAPQRFRLFLQAFATAIVLLNNRGAVAQVGDRVVVAINNIPYTQLQIERYINVKETLRDDVKTSQPVQASNWSMALDAFVRDMMIHQDATKSSGFRPTRESILRIRVKSEKALAEAPLFKSAFVRLGLNKEQLETEILKIGTVENYRRGKKSLIIENSKSTEQWEAELLSRSVVRYFTDGKTWKDISPKP